MLVTFYFPNSSSGLDIVNVIELEGVIIKDYFYTLNDNFFFLLIQVVMCVGIYLSKIR